MRVVHRDVFYCDFCRKYKLTRHAMILHERHCTLNPDRVCRWDFDYRDETEHDRVRPVGDVVVLLNGAEPNTLTPRDVDWVRDDLGGCPACMLAAFRQSHHDLGSIQFDMREEVARRERERRFEADEQERRAIESTWL